MLDIQKKQVEKWATMLDAWGVKFKIILDDGAEFGGLEVIKEKSHKRHLKYPWGLMAAYVKPFVENMAVGDVVAIPFGDYDRKSVQGAASAACHAMWGKGAHNVMTNNKTNCVELMRIA